MTENQDTRADPNTIVLIHGLWVTPRSWEHWVDRYRAAGFEVLAPAWAGIEGEVEDLRRDPSPLAHLNVTEIIDYYDRLIRGLDRPPIIMGHSFGGAFAQVLLDRGLGAAGVVIDSAAVRGVKRLPVSTIRSALPVLRNPANLHRAVELTPEQFHYAFANTLSQRDSMEAYQRYHVPAAGHVLFEAGLANFAPHPATKVDFRNNNRPPLLFVIGGEDHLSPSALNMENANHYRWSTAVTDTMEFPGRCHFTLGQPGWEQVADYALDWARAQTQGHGQPELRHA